MCKVELNKNISFGTCSIVCLLFSAAGYDDAVSVVNFWYCGVCGMNDGMMCHFSTCICVENCQFLFGCQVLSKARKTGSSAPDKTQNIFFNPFKRNLEKYTCRGLTFSLQ